MADLFAQEPDELAASHLQPHRPLAERMRPRTLDQVVGQPHVTDADSALRNMLKHGELRSMIFWGPPGSGKTTLARIVARTSGSAISELSATSSGVKELREVIRIARDRSRHEGKQTIVFIDEIHRFNKSQQDALLHAVEDGTIVLIGATTENPSFEINSALLSRAQLIVLEALDENALNQLLDRAIEDASCGLGGGDRKLDDDARALLLKYAQGDARYLINALELSALQTSGDIDKASVTQAIGKRGLHYDKSGEEHYNLASALIKSMRASDPDAAIYYTVRMLEGGESPRFVARRLAIFASEDIGNAEPQALNLAASAIQVVELIGMPEGFYTLTQLAAYLALSPKSDATKKALAHARTLVRDKGPLPTPLKSRNAPTSMMKELDYGKGYKNPHSESDGVLGESYMPESIEGERLYFPVARGYEQELRKRLNYVLEKRNEKRTSTEPEK